MIDWIGLDWIDWVGIKQAAQLESAAMQAERLALSLSFSSRRKFAGSVEEGTASSGSGQNHSNSSNSEASDDHACTICSLLAKKMLFCRVNRRATNKSDDNEHDGDAQLLEQIAASITSSTADVSAAVAATQQNMDIC
jgi:hypothetical protein